MTYYQLAINEDGDPFEVGPEVKGWRPERASDGRGRPALVHARNTGKPLILPVDASHADLFAQGGPGRYRCKAVDAAGHRIDGVPVACTGPLTADGIPGDYEQRDEPSSAKTALEVVLGHLGQAMNANIRLAEKAVEQMGTVMSGVAQLGSVMNGVSELIRAAHGARLTEIPAPLPPPHPVINDQEDEYEDEEGEDDEDEIDEDVSAAPAPAVATSAIPEMVQFIIRESIAKIVPMIFDKLGSGGGIGGIPLEALLDWRKAATKAAPIDVASSPSAPVPTPSAHPGSAPASTPTSTPTAPPIPSTPVANSTATATPTYAGAAPGGDPPGAVPAGSTLAPVRSSPESEEDAAALLDAHITRIWQGLSPSERTRAGDLIAQLNPEGRAALLAELVRLSVPEAIARARALLDTTPPT